jgi:deoxyribodipyrimidine photo-lyase
MNRDQRASDNWALLFAAERAQAHREPLVVVFNVENGFLGGGYRQHAFKVAGLQETANTLAQRSIPFYLLQGNDTVRHIISFVQRFGIGAVVTDFSPLKLQQEWLQRLTQSVDVPVAEVDAHNVVPVWQASEKCEYAARTIRPKIHRQLDTFLTEFPQILRQPAPWPHEVPSIDWSTAKTAPQFAVDVPPVSWCAAGETAAHEQLQRFLDERLHRYSDASNDPNEHVVSDLSPYLHFGHISAQRIAHAVEARPGTRREDKDAFLEELIVRKELSDNYCFFEPNYDTPSGFPTWAQETLDVHKDDERPYVYTKEEFEMAKTHDDLWNAAQRQMVTTGKMHNYMRMYWAKKILEWTNTPQYAQNVAIELNDRYELDGRDPNGYVGVAWSIGGVHDRGWTERPIFGKVRYMNRNGCKRKFDVEHYIQRFIPDEERRDEIG